MSKDILDLTESFKDTSLKEDILVDVGDQSSTTTASDSKQK